MIIAIVLSSLALLAAALCLLLLCRRCAELEGHLAEAQEKIEALENGSVPDFEKAKEAANAVNDFNAGISGILGFDPMAVIRKQRESAGDV